ncbi:primase C-terminal domain-containing protein [uncultured Amphritea sp.]|uniref:primase C-terminal domain-containing protein n=2 Tax=Pseudomonadota TaxID=1224 RepID=UPI00261EFE02|nr:primase C-terminal domain-containing protein [uncultured Amphritea sp.]
MRDFNTLTDHPVLERMVNIISKKTQNDNRNFFRVECAYFLAKMAAAMRAEIITKDRGKIPVNLYALALATSGFGKGHSVGIIEDTLMHGFKKRFIETTMQGLAEKNLIRLANKRAAYKGTDPSTEETSLQREYDQAGPYPFTFDSGTVPAVKQLRQKLMLSGCGGINLQIDEVGSNLLQSAEIMNTFLELYDKGKTKAKLTKNTVDNSRGIDLDAPTPANMLLFGTPSKLLDGGATEDTFFEFLQTGYARRMLFAWGEQERSMKKRSAADVYAALTDPAMESDVAVLSRGFAQLASEMNHEYQIEVPDNVGILLLEYRFLCEEQADALEEYQDLQKTELGHRYFKALKLAGVYAFLDQSPVMTEDNLYQAIHLVESSGQDFKKLLSREAPYVKLARYIASFNGELTHADLTENLPYYKTSSTQRREIMDLATAWGYKNNIIIKKTFAEGIEFFTGESLNETNTDQMLFTVSEDMATGYAIEVQPFDQMWRLTGTADYHWCNHRFHEGHRRGDKVIEGFNMVVLDVDGETSLTFAHEMLRDYMFMTHTTKRHGEEGKDRFRIVMPLKYELFLNKEDYRQFVNNIMEWLPFDSDEGSNQRERKWMTNPGAQHHYNMGGVLLDPVRFIPKTSKNEQHINQMTELKDLGALERWFAERMEPGNRNNQMIKYALALLDGGLDYPSIEARVIHFNDQLQSPLSENELRMTVLKTVARKSTQTEP